MNLKCLIILLFAFLGLNVKAQVLLNANSVQIEKANRALGVTLSKSSVEKYTNKKGYYKKLVFEPLVTPPEGNACLIDMTFYLTTKDICFKYDETYWGEELAHQRINELKFSCKLIQVKGCLEWIDMNKKFKVNLIPERIGKMKSPSVYIVEIKNN